ncbi:protein FAR1-RELATED SEQUENCE 5-like [Miscanthus floridulus]|uniref:protein FAR1-RELATED SEQUENCE 5-like n=1 Tax=Miscanthus floridulus TaxID=154761 RepID=UPI00345A8B71
MFITTNRIYEPPQGDVDSLRNEESEAVPEFANEENMVHEERQDGQGSEGEQDTEGNMTKQHLVASEEQDEEELRAIQIESQSIMAAERLSHEHASRHVPQLGIKFKTIEDAYSFYNDYAFIVGFSLVKWHTYKCQDKKDHNYGQVTRVTYKCNLSGKRKEDDSTDVSGVRSTRNNKRKISVSGVQSARNNKKKISATPPTPNPVPNKRKTSTLVPTECPAELVVILQNGEWTITRLNLEHNHAFANKDQKNKLFSHIRMTKMEKELIATFNKVNLPDRKIMAVLSYIRGDVTPYNKKHISNEKTKINKATSDNDMQQVYDWFSKKQAEDPMFFYKFSIDENNKVKNIFWSNGTSRRYYEEFGDCISFDTTYNTNKYSLKFAPIVGITGHGDNCLFGCAFIMDETTETFEWLFQTMLTCMGGKHPKTIITDQDLAMKAAIRNVLPDTIHQNCFFHIVKKAQEKGGRIFSLERNKKLHDNLFDILRNSLTETEFEYLYKKLPQTYDVGGFRYLDDMWFNRENFVPCYFKKHFFPFINSTARSEGTNALFKLDVTLRYSIMRFMNAFQRISDTTEKNQAEQDFETRSMPWLSTAYEFERQAARLYNRKIFFKFQKELILATKYEAQELQKDQVYAVLKSEYHRQFEFRTRRYILDDSYFIERWRAKERKQLTRQNTVPEIEIEKSRPLRHNILSNKLSNIASDGSRTMETFNYVLEEAERMQRKLNEPADEVRLQQSQSVQQSGTNVLQDANDAVRLPQTESAQESDTMLLQDPNNAQKRGRPKKVTRQIGIVEDIRSKAKSNFTCTHCREGGHNIKTCQQKHLPPVPKKQRKGNQEMLTTLINSSSASAASKAKKGKVKN